MEGAADVVSLSLDVSEEVLEAEGVGEVDGERCFFDCPRRSHVGRNLVQTFDVDESRSSERDMVITEYYNR